MNFRLGRILLLIAVFGISILISVFFHWPSRSAQISLAPSITLENARTQDSLSLPLSDEVQYVFFWASWCPFCLKEIAVLDSLQSELKNDGLRVVAINQDSIYRQSYERALQRFSPHFLVLKGNRTTLKVFGGAPGLPAAFLIDSNGYVVERIYGYYPLDVLIKKIRAALS